MYLVPVSRHSARAFDRVFDEAFEHFFRNGSNTPAPNARTPALDVAENDGAYTVSVEMPGVAKDDIKVAIDGRRVDVSAESKKESETKDGERIVHRERSATRWSRSFTLPRELDQEASNAKLENGVLTLVLGKKRAPGAAQLTIN
jgi:HSP20 family protein